MKEMFFQMKDLPLPRPNTIIVNLLMLGSELRSASAGVSQQIMSYPIA
jgi:hypothetical protein